MEGLFVNICPKDKTGDSFKILFLSAHPASSVFRNSQFKSKFTLLHKDVQGAIHFVAV
jgi:hypothetical protein